MSLAKSSIDPLLTGTRLGAKVVVNDVQNAYAVADEIKQQGLEATSCDITVERGDAVVQAVLDAYGRIDLVSAICRWKMSHGIH